MRLPSGLVVAALAAALLAGCGSTQAGAAAVVGDRRISESDLQSAMADISTLFKSGQAPTSRQVLTWLVVAPYVQQLASQNRVGVSVADAREIFTSNGFTGTPSPAAVEAVRGVVGLNSLAGQRSSLSQQAQQQAQLTLVKELSEVTVTVSPRFGGTFDPRTLQIGAVTPDWLPTPSATPSPTPTP
jgi:curli biogenesis system outer membrane secretion channel CsgG